MEKVNDKLIRYLINNWGGLVKTDDMTPEEAEDWAIKLLRKYENDLQTRLINVDSFREKYRPYLR